MIIPVTDKDQQIKFAHICYRLGMVSKEQFMEAIKVICHDDDEFLKEEYGYMAVNYN